MGRNIFTSKRSSSKKTTAIVIVTFIIALVFIVNIFNLMNKPTESVKQPKPVPEEIPVAQLPNYNNFNGLSIYHNGNSRYIKFDFTNMGLSNVLVSENSNIITLLVNNVTNKNEFLETSHLMSNIAINVEGESLKFSIDKSEISSRYLIQQTERSLELKIMPPTLEGKRITIDPGHGGIDPGAVGPTRLSEKVVVLPVALRLKELLEAEGAEVILTRYEDQRPVPGSYLQDKFRRVEIAREFDSDLFLSIHNNASHLRNAVGIETLYFRGSVNQFQARQFAAITQRSLVNEFKRRDRGVLDRHLAQLTGENFVSALVEIMFITNPDEERILASDNFTERAAQSLFRAIKDYYEN